MPVSEKLMEHELEKRKKGKFKENPVYSKKWSVPKFKEGQTVVVNLSYMGQGSLLYSYQGKTGVIKNKRYSKAARQFEYKIEMPDGYVARLFEDELLPTIAGEARGTSRPFGDNPVYPKQWFEEFGMGDQVRIDKNAIEGLRPSDYGLTRKQFNMVLESTGTVSDIFRTGSAKPVYRVVFSSRDWLFPLDLRAVELEFAKNYRSNPSDYNPAALLLEGSVFNPFSAKSEPLFMYFEEGTDDPYGMISLKYHPPIWGKNTVHIAIVVALKKGGGRRVMEKIIAKADQHGITLEGTAVPQKSGYYQTRLWSKKKLIDWYNQFGFIEKPPRSGQISRKPR
jgi:ribosomal protein L21E